MSFWDKQLIVHNNNNNNENENENENENDYVEIEIPVILPDCPYKLPKYYEWYNTPSIEELYTFINEHYNKDILYSLRYSFEYLNWYKKDLIICVKTNENIVGCIIGTIENIIIQNKEKKCVFINFLCVHKKLRKKRLSTILIKEITRQISKLNIYIAMYYSSSKLHLPLVQSNIFYYFVNVPKVIKTDFYEIPNTYKRCKVPVKTLTKYYNISTIEHNMIPFTEEYIFDVLSLFNNYFEKFTIHIDFNKYNIKQLLYQENIIYSYISNDKTEFISFYLVPIQTNTELLYNVITLYLISNDYELLFKKLYTIVKELNFDIISIYNIMDNNKLIEKYNFEKGQMLYQYIYNFKHKELKPNENSIFF
jgi:glycylpeptide N-tetradecanoyltransferase